VPRPQTITFPVLLDGPAPQLRSYTAESVVAEKVHAMVTLGIRNTRMKDFFDLVVISRMMTFEGSVLVRAIKATFEKRGDRAFGEAPFVFTDDFARNLEKQNQWSAFVRRGKFEITTNFEKIVAEIKRFALEPLEAAATSGKFKKSWVSGGPWKN
jgi:hypothetical protein